MRKMYDEENPLANSCETVKYLISQKNSKIFEKFANIEILI